MRARHINLWKMPSCNQKLELRMMSSLMSILVSTRYKRLSMIRELKQVMKLVLWSGSSTFILRRLFANQGCIFSGFHVLEVLWQCLLCTRVAFLMNRSQKLSTIGRMYRVDQLPRSMSVRLGNRARPFKKNRPSLAVPSGYQKKRRSGLRSNSMIS